MPNQSEVIDENGSAASGEKLLTRLHSAYRLPNALARIAHYIVENPERTVRYSLSQLSELSGSGQASVVRLCRVLGFSGYKDLKLALAGELALAARARPDQRAAVSDFLPNTRDHMCNSINDTADLIEPNILSEVANRLSTANRTVIYGSGLSGLAAEMFSYRLSQSGVFAAYARDKALAYQMASKLDAGSSAIAISQSGVSRDTVEFAKEAHRQGAFTVAVTCHPDAELSTIVHATLRMAPHHHPTFGYRVIDFPRAILVAEALGEAIASRDKNGVR